MGRLVRPDRPEPDRSLLFVEVELMETEIVMRDLLKQSFSSFVASIRRSGINGNFVVILMRNHSRFPHR
ncbi:hypothetical protein PL11201_700088 [Planktothrix sp. PCC 11201]|nr:hypothetical protein PL11201_700088 [Planktothrix sp. PCC 11201]